MGAVGVMVSTTPIHGVRRGPIPTTALQLSGIFDNHEHRGLNGVMS
jgi:hypothetical protein